MKKVQKAKAAERVILLKKLAETYGEALSALEQFTVRQQQAGR